MKLYVEERDMPKNCTECSCLNDEYWSCQASKMGLFGEGADKKRPDWCPLVPLPQHGKLIDADALCKTLRSLPENEYTPEVFANWIENHIDAIIPASEEG